MFVELYIDRIVNFSGLNVWDPLLFAGTLNVDRWENRKNVKN